MPLNDSEGLSLRWCFHLADALSRCGVRHTFISPGSRSTPLTLALVHHPQITCHSVLDERSAAFMALGAGKESGIPALFVCTSGTAAANAYPAVVEARMAGSPLIVISADRPPNMRATGASQTIDQIKLFGDYPVFFFDTGEPVDSPEDLKRLAHLATQASVFSVEKGGAVHLNMPFRKPLEPTAKNIRECVAIYNRQTDQTGNNCFMPLSTTVKEHRRLLPPDFHNLLSASRRPVVIAGAGTGDHIRFFEWCQNLRIPILCETGGVSGGITKHPLLLQDPEAAESLAPDFIIRTGDQPVHRPTLSALESWHVPQVVFRGHPDRHDATLSATHFFAGSVSDYNWENVTATKIEAGYQEKWIVQCRTVEETQSELLRREKRLTDGHVYSELLPVIRRTEDIHVVLSNSFPIRDYLLFGPPSCVNELSVMVNRGASGIDGVTSTAIGAALASGKPTILFTGDLAFLHDLSALNNLQTRDLHLKIVVVNNRGGSIFRMLPFENYDEVFTQFIETPQQVDLSETAKAHGLSYEHVDTPGRLRDAWERLAAHPIGILECRTDTGASINLRNTV